MGNSQSHEVDLSVVMQLSDEQLVKSIYSINVVQKSSNLNYFTYIILKKKLQLQKTGKHEWHFTVHA